MLSICGRPLKLVTLKLVTFLIGCPIHVDVFRLSLRAILISWFTKSCSHSAVDAGESAVASSLVGHTTGALS